MWSFLVSVLKYFVGTNKKLRIFVKKTTGKYPRNIKYYETALIHKSASIFDDSGIVINNERLEFLGDSILDSVISDYLYHKYPGADEGFLTQMRSRIVNSTSLYDLSKRLLIPQHLIVKSVIQKKSKHHIYGDALEAFIGAIYLDHGYKAAYDFIIFRIVEKLLDIDLIQHSNYNYKSLLIEWGQKMKKNVIFETDVDKTSQNKFVSYVKINDKVYGSGVGASKKEAEQNAAHKALDYISKRR